MHRGDHIALNLPAGEGERKRNRSIWRIWNQLSRFQRNAIYILLTFCFFGMLYLTTADTENLPEAPTASGPIISAIKRDTVHLQSNDDAHNQNSQLRPDVMSNNENVNLAEESHVLEEPKGIRDVPVHNVNNGKAKTEFRVSQTERQKAVVEAFQHAWKGYKRFAWGHDNLKPLSEGYHEWFGVGLTIVDSLDTMFIMGLDNELAEAREWVDKHLSFDVNRDVNLFEITIRVLGGLLSAYHMTGDDLYLNKAVDLGDRLMTCFESVSGVPFSDVNLFTRKAHAPKWSPDSSTSEVTTIQLEFRDLSRCTGNPKYERVVSDVSQHVHNLEKKDGLVPIFINANTGSFSYATVTLGARGDSYYEYLLKQWIQTGKTIDYLKDDYIEAIHGVEKHLVKRTVPNGFLFIGELLAGGKEFKPKMDHLTCYLPGTLALGVHNGLSADHMRLAEDLLTTCYQTYAQQPTFLAPEITYFNIQGENSNDMYVKTNDAHNLLRPEFIESLFYMYQLTGNATYQTWGWQIFEGFQRYTKVANGYTSIGNVRSVANVRPKDMMESFFLSETLKYLYLLFADDPKLLDVDKYVINSEAHPLPIYKS